MRTIARQTLSIMKKHIFLLFMLSALSQAQITLTPKGGTAPGGEAAAEISAYDPGSHRVFSTNAANGRIDVFQLTTAGTLSPAFNIPVGGAPNSVAIREGIVAVAVENSPRTNPGRAKFYDINGQLLAQVNVGAVPDMITFTPNGRRVLVANEGEPNSYGRADSLDPEGSVSVIDMTGGVTSLDQSRVRTARFSELIPQSNASSIRRYGPNASFAQDMEPEYLTVSHDSKTAWITLQENNAMAVLDIESAEFTRIVGLGFKDHRLTQNKVDPSDLDGGINIATWPIYGMYEPDAIDTYRIGGQTYFVMANEGDTRDYPGFNEEARVRTLTLDASAFPDAAMLKADSNLGRLTVTKVNGDADGDLDYDALYVPGGRSFSIRRLDGTLVWDSGSDFETITAAQSPSTFNSNGTATTFDTRSDNKGPEPEGLVVGKAFGRDYAFIGFERTGGIMVYDISNPESPAFVQWVNTAPADISPEGILFVKAEHSPTGNPLLVVNYEITGTVRVFEITKK